MTQAVKENTRHRRVQDTQGFLSHSLGSVAIHVLKGGWEKGLSQLALDLRKGPRWLGAQHQGASAEGKQGAPVVSLGDARAT